MQTTDRIIPSQSGKATKCKSPKGSKSHAENPGSAKPGPREPGKSASVHCKNGSKASAPRAASPCASLNASLKGQNGAPEIPVNKGQGRGKVYQSEEILMEMLPLARRAAKASNEHLASVESELAEHAESLQRAAALKRCEPIFPHFTSALSLADAQALLFICQAVSDQADRIRSRVVLPARGTTNYQEYRAGELARCLHVCAAVVKFYYPAGNGQPGAHLDSGNDWKFPTVGYLTPGSSAWAASVEDRLIPIAHLPGLAGLPAQLTARDVLEDVALSVHGFMEAINHQVIEPLRSYDLPTALALTECLAVCEMVVDRAGCETAISRLEDQEEHAAPSDNPLIRLTPIQQQARELAFQVHSAWPPGDQVAGAKGVPQ